MNDLEICKRIAEIEKQHGDFSVHAKTGAFGRRYIDGTFTPYNPLTDDALCFQQPQLRNMIFMGVLIID